MKNQMYITLLILPLRATGEFKGYTLSYKGLSMNDM